MNKIPQDWELQSDGTYIDSQGDRFDDNGTKIKFTKDANIGYPKSKSSDETYGQYRNRVDEDYVKKGFHLGDLSWSDWSDYCKAGDFPYERSASWPDECRCDEDEE